jgi:hypothetical protein
VAELLAQLLAEQRSDQPAEPIADHTTRPRLTRRRSLLAHVNEQIGDTYSFVARFVELDAGGKGHCPFHPPDHHASFVVSRALDRWTCFHEYDQARGRYLGGDAIDFYMKLKGMDYKEVLKELKDS